MFLAYFKKRKAKSPNEVTFYFGKGRSVTLPLGKATEVDEKWGYDILSNNSDIIKQTDTNGNTLQDVPPVEAPKNKKKTASRAK
jgi:hypothetical protein